MTQMIRQCIRRVRFALTVALVFLAVSACGAPESPDDATRDSATASSGATGEAPSVIDAEVLRSDVCGLLSVEEVEDITASPAGSISTSTKSTGRSEPECTYTLPDETNSRIGTGPEGFTIVVYDIDGEYDPAAYADEVLGNNRENAGTAVVGQETILEGLGLGAFAFGPGGRYVPLSSPPVSIAVDVWQCVTIECHNLAAEATRQIGESVDALSGPSASSTEGMATSQATEGSQDALDRTAEGCFTAQAVSELTGWDFPHVAGTPEAGCEYGAGPGGYSVFSMTTSETDTGAGQLTEETLSERLNLSYELVAEWANSYESAGAFVAAENEFAEWNTGFGRGRIADDGTFVTVAFNHGDLPYESSMVDIVEKIITALEAAHL
jgi:hypothetical protein